VSRTKEVPVPRTGLRLAAQLAILLSALAALPLAPTPADSQTAAPPDSAAPALPTTLPADSTGGILPAAPGPPSGLVVTDVGNDAGRALDLAWKGSADDQPGLGAVSGYRLERSESPGGPWTLVDSTKAGITQETDQSVRRNTDYFYRVTAIGPGGAGVALSVTGPVRATSQWINQTRWSVLVMVGMFFGFVLFFISSAQSGKMPFVRRIPGIDAIEEAIGRATEMGRSVLYVPGILDIDDIQTVAGLVILESVARLTAKYETPITVPVTYPIPFTIAEEMVKSGYLHAGRPEAYDPNSVRFVSPEQFAYTAAVGGIMLRDKPAAHIFMGAFYAESLLLAETGFSTGAIQVAGTANVAQLPFFVVACDYTLIGEELYAASAYLSKEPKLVGGLKGADLMKLVILALAVVGCVLETLGIHGLSAWMQTQ
jgi:uncharacterized protein DUF6754